MIKMTIQNELKNYLKEINKKLICPQSLKRKFLTDLKNDINDYVISNNVSDISSVYAHFGTSDEVTEAFMETNDHTSMKKKLKIKKGVLISVAITLVALTICLILSFIYSNSKNTSMGNFEDGSYIVTTFKEDTAPSLNSSQTAPSQTKLGSKCANYYNSNGELKWSVIVYGTFSYDGNSATCTNSSTSYKIYNDNWKVVSAAESKSKNQAFGDFIVNDSTISNAVEYRVALSCKANGDLY